MSFIVGTGTTCQMGVESAYGTKATMTDLVNLTSETISTTVEKADEGSLLASKTAMSRDLMSITVGGDVSFILRPEFAGHLFYAAMGGADSVSAVSEGDEGFYTHTMNLCEVNDDLPTITITMDRKAAVKAYTGCTVSNLTLSCAAGDYVSGSFTVNGYKEETGVLGDVTSYTVPSYRCTSATFKVNEEVYDISSSTLTIDNALVTAPQTYSSGLYAGQPQHGLRNVTIDFDIPYSTQVETLKQTMLETEVTAEVVLTFTSSDQDYKIQVTMPNVSINSVSANVSGTGLITAGVSGEALSVGDEEPITVVITDDVSTAYGA